MLVPPPKPPVSSQNSETFRAGDFDALTRAEAVLWLKLIGAADLRSRSATDEDVFTRLKHALWDAQRIDNIFHGAVFSEKKVTKPKSKSKSKSRSKPKPKLNPSSLPTWPDWKEPHPELVVDTTSPLDVDGTEDAERLDSYVQLRGAFSTNLKVLMLMICCVIICVGMLCAISTRRHSRKSKTTLP